MDIFLFLSMLISGLFFAFRFRYLDYFLGVRIALREFDAFVRDRLSLASPFSNFYRSDNLSVLFIFFFSPFKLSDCFKCTSIPYLLRSMEFNLIVSLLIFKRISLKIVASTVQLGSTNLCL